MKPFHHLWRVGVALLLGYAAARLIEGWLKDADVNAAVIPAAQKTSPPTKLQSPLDPPDDLTQIKGIGPVFGKRLNEANIYTFAALAALDVEKLRQVTGLKDWQAADPEEWVAQAAQLAATRVNN